MDSGSLYLLKPVLFQPKHTHCNVVCVCTWRGGGGRSEQHMRHREEEGVILDGSAQGYSLGRYYNYYGERVERRRYHLSPDVIRIGGGQLQLPYSIF